jgi:ABC-type sugar transport system substrate-binding protein
VGNVTGNFVAAIAKAETLKFLAAHPEPIDGIFDINSMASGAIAAFDQSGRPMPAVSMVGASKAGVGYWAKHRDEFKGISAGLSTVGYGLAIADVASRMLAGDGIKLNVVAAGMPPITTENIDEWADDRWTLETPGAIPGPPTWLEDGYLDGLFSTGGDAG